jgi:hypothetical protein
MQSHRRLASAITFARFCVRIEESERWWSKWLKWTHKTPLSFWWEVFHSWAMRRARCSLADAASKCILGFYTQLERLRAHQLNLWMLHRNYGTLRLKICRFSISLWWMRAALCVRLPHARWWRLRPLSQRLIHFHSIVCSCLFHRMFAALLVI